MVLNIILLLLLVASWVFSYLRIEHWRNVYDAAIDELKDQETSVTAVLERAKVIDQASHELKSVVGQLLSRPLIATLSEKDANNLTMAILAHTEAIRNPNKLN